MEITQMTDVKLVALYARVSTNDKGQDPELQLQPLREYALRTGWTVVGEYVDRGVSGSKESRPELNRLLEDAKTGAFNVVAVWKFDRAARSVVHLHKILQTLKALDIAFASVTEQADTTTPAGKMMFTILGAFAEMERELIGERVKAGMRNAKSKGIQLGPKPIEIDLTRVHIMKAEGKSAREISRALDISVTTIRRRLQEAA
jgi:DNA invertase Pin-like site-specific DNA recombinase